MDVRESELNPAQQAAVDYGDGPLLVLAGPGSGKTRVVTSRIAQLIRSGVPPTQMLALTFTNKAASEMAARVAYETNSPGVWVSTFHRFCSRLLRQYASFLGLDERFTIYDTEDSQSLLKSVIQDADVPTGRFTPRQIGQAMSRAKNDLLTPDELSESRYRPIDTVVAEIYPLYQKRLLAANAVDFDDLLLHIVRLLQDNPDLRQGLDEKFRYIIVDEYQDTNLAQYAIVRGLSLDHPNLTVTGDPDQSIYAWRGANIENILRFEQDYPQAHVIRLEQNYRSTASILDAADRLIAANKQRKAKQLWTENPSGCAVRVVEYDTGPAETEGIVDRIATLVAEGQLRHRDCAILYRTNALSRAFEHVLRSRGLPYQVVRGIEFYRRKEIKDILAYLQLMLNPQDEVALMRIINAPPRGIGKVSLQKWKGFAARHQLSLAEALRDERFLGSLSKRIAKSVLMFTVQLDKMIAQGGAPIELLVRNVLEVSGYREHLQESNHEEDRQRLANVEELCTAAREFDETNQEVGDLEGFLEQAALVNDIDDWAEESDRVTLLTMHAAKGLEFPAVFIVAAEDGILPHERCRDNVDQLEEERRLMFVGMTRAKQFLEISCARSRDYRGRIRRCVPSLFLMDIHHETIDFHRQESLTWPVENDIADYAHEIPSPIARTATAEAAAPTSTAPLMTAADMLGDSDDAEETAQANPDRFELGTLVIHPKFGPGKIVRTSGRGVKKKVAVQFVESSGQPRNFSVAHSPLRPINP